MKIDENWQRNLYDHLGSNGHQSLMDYLHCCQGESYVNVASRLGGFSAFQIQQCQMLEAFKQGVMREAAKDALVRFIRDRLPRGWGIGQRAEYNAAGAFTDWVTCLKFDADLENAKEIATQVWDELLRQEPKKGWQPLDNSDQLIEAAFAAGWY